MASPYAVTDRIRFLGIPEEPARRETSRYAVLPVPYEATTTYRRGTRYGPEAILRASAQVELYDEETAGEPWKDGIHTAPPVLARGPSPEFFETLHQRVYELAEGGRFVVSLGGEHALSEGPVGAYASLHPDLSILHIDAHADLRAQYEGSVYNHACAARRLLRHAPLVQAGVRCVSEEEAPVLNTERCRTFLMYRTRPFEKHIPRIVKALSPHVYVSLDLDGLDPSVVPGVGTPVPGGLLWYDLLGLLRALFDEREVVGADVVELCPIEGQAVSEFAVARIVYKMIAYHAASARRVVPRRAKPRTARRVAR